MKKYLVWDLPTRVFHWLLVVMIGLQWLTSELGGDYLTWHFYIGYATLGLVLFRLIWGFVGSRYARFWQFLVSPKKVVEYLRGTNKQAYIGHNPLGGLMVLLLLILVLVQAVTGLFTTDEIFTDGPYRSAISSEWQDIADWLHANLFDYLLVAIGLHVAAVLFYLGVKKTNLILPMLTGKKAISKQQGIPSSKLLTALVCLLLVVVLVVLLVQLAPAGSGNDFYY